MLSSIAREFFQDSPALIFPIVGLALFVAVFVAVVVRVLRTRSASYDKVASLPLSEDS